MDAEKESTRSDGPPPAEPDDSLFSELGLPPDEYTPEEAARRVLDAYHRYYHALPRETAEEKPELARLIADVVTAAHGPPERSTDPDGAMSPAERRREREAARIRLIERAPRPIHKERWKRLRGEILSELRERGPDAADAPLPDEWEKMAVGVLSPLLEDEVLDAWQVEAILLSGAADGLDAEQVPPALRALYSAVLEAVQDEALRELDDVGEKFEGAFRSALQAAFAGDLAAPGWKTQSNSAASRRNAEARLQVETELRPADVEASLKRRAALDEHQRDAETRARELTKAQRAVYLLVERDGYAPQEAAEELDISKAAARNRLKRARREVGTAR